MELKGIEYLRRKLEAKRRRVLLRYRYYEMKNEVKDLGIATPPDLRFYQSTLGWCAAGVDKLADRLVFRTFKDDNLGIMDVYNMNNPDTLFDSAVLGALIGSCSFIYITPGEKKGEYPRLQVIDGSDATGIIDPITGLLTEGYVVLTRNDKGDVIREAYLYPNTIEIHTRENRGYTVETYTNNVEYPLLVPIIFRPDAARPFGHSRISRACMKLVDDACNILKRTDVSAEFYSFPQKYVTGLDTDASQFDKWKATMSAMMAFELNSDGQDHVRVGQFNQQSMEPHIAHLRMIASLFAGETGLTLDDLGISTENPSSVEAIKAQHENLRLTARKAERTFGTGFLNAGYLARCLMDDQDYRRDILYMTKPIWEPVFEPDASTLSLIGDGAIKINQAIPNYFDRDSLWDLTGIKPSDNTGIDVAITEEVEEVNG